MIAMRLNISSPPCVTCNLGPFASALPALTPGHRWQFREQARHVSAQIGLDRHGIGRPAMRHVLAASAVFVLAACGQPPAETPASPAVEAATPEPAPPAARTLALVEGWEVASLSYPGIGSSLPEFSGARLTGEAVTRETLRGRWTILGFDGFDTTSDAEKTHVSALNSAVDQDPDLDFLQVYRMPEGVTAQRVSKWPSISDDGSIFTALGVTQTPAYLLVGPDLTVEAWRGALSENPTDGIKPVIMGVHEIRKQVAAPQ
jgi:hypothetical protein